MTQLYTVQGRRFKITVRHNFGRQNLDLLNYVKYLSNDLRTKAVRSMVSRGGSILAKKIRKTIPQMVSDKARSKGRASRRKARMEGQSPLVRTIRVRVRSQGRKGIVYAIVGPKWPEGAHGHLVEFGHRIVWKRKKFTALKHMTGRRTKPVPFQERAMVISEHEIYWAMATRLKRWLWKQDNPHLKGTLRAWL